METSGTGVITWDDFQSSVNSKDMKELLLVMACYVYVCTASRSDLQELFKAIDLDISEAHCAASLN